VLVVAVRRDVLTSGEALQGAKAMHQPITSFSLMTNQMQRLHNAMLQNDHQCGHRPLLWCRAKLSRSLQCVRKARRENSIHPTIMANALAVLS
jgi:hypothetical protein